MKRCKKNHSQGRGAQSEPYHIQANGKGKGKQETNGRKGGKPEVLKENSIKKKRIK